jgi:hypothetical protein
MPKVNECTPVCWDGVRVKPGDIVDTIFGYRTVYEVEGDDILTVPYPYPPQVTTTIPMDFYRAWGCYRAWDCVCHSEPRYYDPVIYDTGHL